MTDRPDTYGRNIHAPGYRSRDREMVPRMLLWAMVALAFSALALTSYAVLTKRPLEGVPSASTVLRERWVILEGHGAKAVTVRDTDGALLLDMAHGGFVTVIQNGLETERKRHRVDPLKPVRIVEYQNGRLAAEDPETGWSVELYAFGSDNKAAFERLLDHK
jgi:putative photosynthetic complex assembly protein